VWSSRLRSPQRSEKGRPVALSKWAFTLRPLLTWFQPDAQVSWRALEEWMLAPYSFANVLHSNNQFRLRCGPIISYLLFIWRKVEKLAGCSSGWGILQYIYGEGELLTFQNIYTKYGTPRTSVFFNLQLRSSLKDNGVPLQGPFTLHTS